DPPECGSPAPECEDRNESSCPAGTEIIVIEGEEVVVGVPSTCDSQVGTYRKRVPTECITCSEAERSCTVDPDTGEIVECGACNCKHCKRLTNSADKVVCYSVFKCIWITAPGPMGAHCAKNGGCYDVKV